MIVLLGHQRSGTTWIQYITSTLTSFMSVNATLTRSIHKALYKNDKYSLDCMQKNPTSSECLGIIDKLQIKTHDFDSQIILEHQGRRIVLDPVWRHDLFAKDIKMVFVLRDYREGIYRNILSSNEEEQWQDFLLGYSNTIKQYEEFERSKILIRYEDLILHPEVTIKNLLLFMNDFDEQKYTKFLKNMDWHKERSLELYTGSSKWGGKTSYTKGDLSKLDFHRKHRRKDFPSEIKLRDCLIEAIGEEIFSKHFERSK